MSSHAIQNESRIPDLDEVTTAARILVVEDDDILRGLHEAVLNTAGYGTDSAADGDEALVMLGLGSYDLVLTDGNMPRLDGIGLVRALRAGGSQIPVVMVSGTLADEGQLPRDVRDEIAVALPKPARCSEILASVAYALRGSGDTTNTAAFQRAQAWAA